MNMTRLAFLRTLGSLAATWCGLASVVRATPLLAEGAPLPGATECCAATFAAVLHSRFRVSDNSGHRADLELTHVHELACDPSLEQFSLVFEDAGGTVSLDSTCRFDHPALGRMTLFVTADALANPRRFIYQASFNRRITVREA